MVDSGNYREKREKTLENLAKKLSSQVIRTGRSVTLEPMNPYERRVIHATIQGIDGVTSSSIGEEPSRRVVISSTNPVKKNYHRDRSAESGERGERSRDRGSRGGRGGRSGRGGYEKRPPREKYVPQDVTPNGPRWKWRMTANRCIPKLKSTENMLYLFAAVYQKTGADERSAPVFCLI